MTDLDTNIRTLQKAVDALETAKGALRDFMNEQDGNRWKRDFLDAVCDVQNQLHHITTTWAWEDIEAGANRMPRGEEL